MDRKQMARREQKAKTRIDKTGSNNSGNDLQLLVIGTALILFIVFLAYLPVTKAGFIWDDDTFLWENPLVEAKDGLYRFWFTTEPPDYFPLTSTTLWLEWRLWGMDATGYHIINILLHALSSVILWMVFRELKIPGAWVAALVFGIHPVNVESVAWITERKNTLPMFFNIFSILYFLKYVKTERTGLYLISLFSFLLALLSKTSVVMTPFVLLLCIWWLKGKIQINDLKKTAAYFILSFVLSLATIWFQYNRAIGVDIVRNDGLISRTIVAGWAVWFYLFKALIPIQLSFVYPRWEVDPGAVVSYLPGVLLGILLVVLWWKRNAWARPFCFGFGYYLINLFPVIGFFNIYFMKYSLVADHWQYTSIVGIIALTVGIVFHYQKNLKKDMKSLFLSMTGIILCLLFFLTWKQSIIYMNEDTLWKDTLKKNPKAGLAHHNLGRMLHEKKDYEKAVEHYLMAMQIMPNDMLVPYNLANTFKEQGKVEEAISYYQKAIEINPDFFHAYNNLGLAYAGKGEFEKAMQCFQKVLQINPRYLESYINIANLLAEHKRYREAINYYLKTLEIDPENILAVGNLANVLAETGRYEDAMEYYDKALKLNPEDPVIRKNRDITLKRMSGSSFND